MGAPAGLKPQITHLCSLRSGTQERLGKQVLNIPLFKAPGKPHLSQEALPDDIRSQQSLPSPKAN